MDTVSYEIIANKSIIEELAQNDGVKIFRSKDEDKYNIKINISKYASKYTNNSLKESMEMINEVLKKVDHVIRLKRLDFNLDFNEEFKDLKKINTLLIGLLGLKLGNLSNFIKTECIISGEQRSILLKTSTKEYVYYDKDKQSLGRHPFSSRLEFRFKRVSRLVAQNRRAHSEKKLIKELIPLLESTVDLFSKLEKIVASELINQKNICNSNNSFKAYVYNSRELFLTRCIFDDFYNNFMKGSSDNYLRFFRRSNSLQFISKSQFSNYIKLLISRIEHYLDN